jgi:hypothetical protein
MSAYRVFKATYTKNGESKKTAKWYVEFRDQLNTVRRLAGFTSKSATDELGRNLAKLVEYHKATGGQVDPSLSRWLAGAVGKRPHQTRRDRPARPGACRRIEVAHGALGGLWGGARRESEHG